MLGVVLRRRVHILCTLLLLGVLICCGFYVDLKPNIVVESFVMCQMFLKKDKASYYEQGYMFKCDLVFGLHSGAVLSVMWHSVW